ncbi:uncharacterized protein LOC132613775 isoform X1 [Lycium barbarum]|uniref:uncharacterized protein LOC132613775 isoform X1 n=1 Tax=Lycium barbarum TaxID=112863 RepID=UPI00293E272A|nr:uncharacterized protein LOC132613775 isoform X1 [Lycium barbarum]
MAMRSVVSSSGLRRLMEGGGRSSVSGLRYFSDSTGRILSEEERAKETVYIQKMERERMEKARKRAEKERAEREKADKESMDRIDPANPGSPVGVETL